jgi:hypothetical protein
MRATRRRARKTDPLASARAVEAVLRSLRASLPEIIPKSNKALTSMLQAVRSLYARSATDTKRGRPGRFPRENLLRVDSQLRSILARETSISVRSFVGQYLPILDFPRDVRDSLECGEINLFEAHQLVRLTPKRLGITEVEATTQRRKLLEAHLMALESGARLRARVKEMLGELEEPSPTKTEALAVEKADELLEVDPTDSTHLFYEELRRIGRAIRRVKAEGLTEEDFNSLMPLLDELSTVLHRIEVRRRPKALELRKVSV